MAMIKIEIETKDEIQMQKDISLAYKILDSIEYAQEDIDEDNSDDVEILQDDLQQDKLDVGDLP